ncbi:hypothetical protein C6H64_03145 [Photorhabdus luminescens]|nr:hypothetical protein C6H64_03145 [Photorhabdus luminescens]
MIVIALAGSISVVWPMSSIFLTEIPFDILNSISRKTELWLYLKTLTVNLSAQGFIARRGQVIDATLISTRKQHNTRDENQRIREGHPLMTGGHTSAVKKIPRQPRRKNTVKIILVISSLYSN